MFIQFMATNGTFLRQEALKILTNHSFSEQLGSVRKKFSSFRSRNEKIEFNRGKK